MPCNTHHFVGTQKDLLSHPKIDPTLFRGFEGATTTPLKISDQDALGIYIKKHLYAVCDIQNFWERLVPEDHNQHDAMSYYLRSNTLKVKSRKLRESFQNDVILIPTNHISSRNKIWSETS